MLFKRTNVSLPKVSVLLLLLVALLVACANGYPSSPAEQEERVALFEPPVLGLEQEEVALVADPPVPSEGHQRFKRATCDLTSGTGAGSSICAAHCILKGFRGGYCNDKLVCVCR